MSSEHSLVNTKLVLFPALPSLASLVIPTVTQLSPASSLPRRIKSRVLSIPQRPNFQRSCTTSCHWLWFECPTT
ncbi:hypothetical protein R3P38DRAFT_3044869 [Favolaschia claudopus]|uniref:Uncharacterized protein n=1 Tax=Favolaschia claudopus TaxID=2862362 RepID=A0AAW0A7B3_9AGAR